MRTDLEDPGMRFVLTALRAVHSAWRRARRHSGGLGIALLSVVIPGCAQPGLRADALAAAAGFARMEVAGANFRHVAFVSADAGLEAPIWVFIEGDGVPWIN